MSDTPHHAVDFVSLARRLSRDRFVAQVGPFLFLVAERALVRPSGPQKTRVSGGDDETQSYPSANPDPLVDDGPQLVLPIVKHQPQFPSMITLGRTANNDLVVPDVSVSKFHAWFRRNGDRLELADARSRNGTFVGARALVADAAPVAVHSGEALRFGRATFTLLDAARTWDAVRDDEALDW